MMVATRLSSPKSSLDGCCRSIDGRALSSFTRSLTPFRPRKPRELRKEIFQNEPLIHRMIEPNRPIFAGVHIVHLAVKFGRRKPIVAAAILIHHHTNCRGVPQ